MKRKNKNTKAKKKFKEKIKKKLTSEEKDIKDIWRRIRKRDFSGNIGLAIKNSVYQFSTNLTGKIGSFIFTVILARLLMPELFGFYSLALSTILIFGTLSELGLETTLKRFLSREFGKKKRKLKAYTIYLGKIKIMLIFLSSILFLVSAKYIANTFYQKPIFLALLVGILYVTFNHFNGFLKSMLHAANNFSSVFKREVIFQISRIILVPLVIVFAIKYSLSSEINLMLIILFLAFSFLLASICMFLDARKIYSGKMRKEKTSTLPKKQKTATNKFLIATVALVLSGTFFGNIDKIMLGKFVAGEFIGFYTAAISLMGAVASLIGFSSVVLLPIFSRLKGKRLEAGFKKSTRKIFLLSTGAFLVTMVFAYVVVLIVYGKEYIPATNILRILALLLLILPLNSIYTSYYISQGKPQKLAKFLIVVTVLNVILNYILITFLLQYSQLAAVYGAAIATVISQGVYFGILVIGKK